MTRAIFLSAIAVLLAGPIHAAQAPDSVVEYPDPDTDKACSGPSESPECAAKTFWLCTEKSIATCKLTGLNVQADGTQHKEDGTVAGDAWIKPWTLTWTELLAITHANYRVWQIEGLREITPQRLRGVPGSRRVLAGTHELMIAMVDAKGAEEKESVFLVQKKGVWSTTGFARWRAGEAVNTCDKRKLGSLACRYAVPNMAPWELAK